MQTRAYDHLSRFLILTGRNTDGLRLDIWKLIFENQYLLAYLILINIVSFFIFGLDKLKAGSKSYRIPEKSLFSLALIGGAAGEIIAMVLFRHKTRKAAFALGMPLILILQLVLAYVILKAAG